MEFCPSSGQILASQTTPDPILKAFKVYNYIIGQGGEIELYKLTKPPSPLAKLSEIKICEWLKDFSELAQGDQQIEKPCFTLQSKETNTVKVCLRVKLCSIYEQKSSCKHGENCLQWHICREFLSGNCKDQHCPRSHDFFDKQNIKKTQKFMLEKHNNSSIRKVFAKNLPFLCENYVSSNGCPQTMNCEFIHLCPSYVKGTCENDYCPLSHSVELGNNKAIFKHFGVPTKYVLAHVLFPSASLLSTESKDVSKKATSRKGKVQNLNNLDTETQACKTLLDNVTLNIHQNISNTSKNNKQSHAVKDEKASIDYANPNVRDMQKQERTKGKIKGPKPLPQLMDQKLSTPGYPQYSEPFPSLPLHPPLAQLPSHAMPQNVASESQQKRRGPQKKNVKITDDKEKRPFGSKEDLEKSGSMTHISGAKPKKKQQGSSFGKKGGVQDNLQPVEHEFVKGDSAKNVEQSEQENQPKNEKQQRRRTRQRKKKSLSQGEGTDHATQEEIEKEEECEEVDLIQFDEDDYPMNEEKLIDLEFDDCDPGLSQMTETESKAMWDLFSQDLLYSLDDQGLSQSSDLSQEPFSSSKSQPDAVKNASDKAIFNCLVLKYGGTAKFSDISNNNDLWDPCFQEKEQWFRRRKAMFLLIEDSKGNIDEVKAVCFKARMCFRYEKGSCTNQKCPYFHVCKEYIANGRCSNYKGSCHKSHSFKEDHNKRVASQLFPDNEYTNAHLRQLILSSTLQVCMDYNNHCCTLGRRCTKVHVCKNFGYKRCPKGQCRLLHQNAFSPHNNITKALLARFRVHLNPKVKLFMFAKTLLQVDGGDKGTSTSSVDSGNVKMSSGVEAKSKGHKKENVDVKPTHQSDSSQYHTVNGDVNIPICIAFLIGKCDQGIKCSEHHCPLPYQWVYKSGSKWRMIDKDKNVEIEKSYCEGSINTPSDIILSMKLDLSSKPELSHMHNVPYIYNINLKDMKIGSLDETGVEIPIKRLSTLSSVLIPDCCLATTWCWYWKNEHGLYEEYKSSNQDSKTIEGFYQEGVSRYNFSINAHQYRLYFNYMYQKNMDPRYLTKRDVIRRPQFVSLGKFHHLKNSCKLPKEFISSQMPSHWKKMTEIQMLLLKRLNTNSREFKEIKTHFISSMGDRQIVINAIDRVQNPFMWEKYSRKKDQMLKRTESKEIDERRLFHGTSHKNIRAICLENFDWRLSGEVTGDIYGKGTYFARDASFSHCYCHDDEDGIRYVFVAKVLVGSYTKGKKDDRLPPLKNPCNPHSDRYDSCVDKVDNPEVFVVSDVDQYYPEYVIEYSNQSVVNQASRSASHRHSVSDPMATSYANRGVSMASSSSSFDPYSRQHYAGQAASSSSYSLGQASSPAAAYSSPQRSQYSVGSYPIGQASPATSAYSSPQRDQYSLGSYAIGQAASATPAYSSHQRDQYSLGSSATPAYSSPQRDQYSLGSYPIGQAAPTMSPQRDPYSVGKAAAMARPSSQHESDFDPFIGQMINLGASVAKQYTANSKSTSSTASRPRSEHYSRSSSVPDTRDSNMKKNDGCSVM